MLALERVDVGSGGGMTEPTTAHVSASAAPLLEVEHVEKTFGGGRWLLGRRRTPVRAVDNVSFSLQAGETLGLVGETGSGKSTLGRLVLRLIEPNSGRITFAGQDMTAKTIAEVRRLRSELQMVFQDPYGSLDPRMSVGSLIAEPMIVHGHPRAAVGDRVAQIMGLVGLDARQAYRYPHEFSGGQRQRIGIARAMAMSPKLLVLDEPVSALDVSIQAQILNLLRDIQRRTGVAYLFIAHDLAVVRHVSDRVAVMYLGRIVEMATRDQLYGAPKHPYTISLLSAVPLASPKLERTRQRIPLYGEISSGTAVPSGCRFHPRCFRARLVAAAGKVEIRPLGGHAVPKACEELDPALTVSTTGHRVACHFGSEHDAAATEATTRSGP
jgi:oligopeptide/dipeptide ABC transporter ATP-binding protein